MALEPKLRGLRRKLKTLGPTASNFDSRAMKKNPHKAKSKENRDIKKTFCKDSWNTDNGGEGVGKKHFKDPE